MAKPRARSMVRAQSASSDALVSYYCELNAVMTKYSLKDAPQLIYNMDETETIQRARCLRGSITTKHDGK